MGPGHPAQPPIFCQLGDVLAVELSRPVGLDQSPGGSELAVMLLDAACGDEVRTGHMLLEATDFGHDIGVPTCFGVGIGDKGILCQRLLREPPPLLLITPRQSWVSI